MSTDGISEIIVGLDTPNGQCTFVPAKAGELLTIGNTKIRILEDGSHTDNRVGTVEVILPPNTRGPPLHWHEMHDECFLVTKGMLRFDTYHGAIEAHEGDYVTVPPRSPHTFSNPTDQEGRCICTCTPAFYVNYFRLLSRLQTPGKPMDPKISEKAMAKYGTITV